MSADVLTPVADASTTHSSSTPRVGIVIIGAGPAAVMVLERLVANHERDAPELGIDIQLVDPHEPGGGRIWRRDQSPLLKLNSMFEDVAFFTDSSCQIEGPVVPGPSLAEWLDRVRSGEIALPTWVDDRIREEVATATGRDFPTRRLNNAYLDWAYRETLRRARPTLTVAWRQDRAVAVNPLGRAAGEPHVVRLASGAEVHADLVVHAVGHNGSRPSAESIRLAAFAQRHDLGYVAPAFTADLDLDWVPAGEDVIVRGMGLAAVDLTVLLTEGRGGRFETRGDGSLTYLPSGREPILHLGSRRGVPYRSKITSRPVGEPVALEYLGPEFHERIAQRETPLDFERDAWPLIAAEMLTGYYRELFTGHPDRVVGTWEDFSRRLREILSSTGGFGSAPLNALIRERVPHLDDRFDLAAFDRPLAFEPDAGDAGVDAAGVDGAEVDGSAVDASAVDRRVRQHIEQDLRLRTTQDHSATQALFLTLLFAFMSLAEVPAEKWNAKSRTRSLPGRWHSYFSYLASGPPGHRLEELLALSDAGIVHFLGGDLELRTDEESGAFVASGSARVAGGLARTRVSTRTLIDAWLPEAQAASSDNPLLRQLVSSGQARELSISDAVHSGTTGQILVGGDGSLADAPGQFAIGPFTSVPGAGAFTRPGLNSLSFRLFDRRARAILEAAQDLIGSKPTGRQARTSPPVKRE